MTLIESLKRIGDQSADVKRVPDEEIPCKETSDKAKLCRNPVVSVVMITYNHEKYIREAIESVLCQQTNFEYELILGEDCSTDRTREICFEYQAKYPEKVRVLWADENVYKIDGNERRCIYHARGEYLAFCEGDDYWTDPLKLQKQVDLLRKTDSVMCVAFNDWAFNDGTVKHCTYEPKEILTAEDFKRHYFHTTTYVIRRETFAEMKRRYPNITAWHDVLVEFGVASLGQVCLLPKNVSAYRRNREGVASSLGIAERPFFASKLFFDLYCNGPAEQRAYAACQALSGLDAVFCVNRSYQPSPMSWSKFRELFAAHWYLRRELKKTIAITFRDDLVYLINVFIYGLRHLLMKVGLGCVMHQVTEQM